MSDPQGILIPKGIQEKITIEIGDEVAIYYFKDNRITKRFANIEIEGDKIKGLPQTTYYFDRVGKAMKKYPGKKKEEVRDLVLEQLKKLNVNTKIK